MVRCQSQNKIGEIRDNQGHEIENPHRGVSKDENRPDKSHEYTAYKLTSSF
jgi:hypothetical protein